MNQLFAYNFQINYFYYHYLSVKSFELPFMYILIFYTESAIINQNLDFNLIICLHVSPHYIDNVVYVRQPPPRQRKALQNSWGYCRVADRDGQL